MRLILEVIIFLSLSGILFLFIKSLPRLDDRIFERKKRTFSDNWYFNFFAKIDEKIFYIFEYFLRQLRVWLLKLDNKISIKLEKFKKNNKELIVLDDLKEERNQEEGKNNI